jgi:hypothetical protein
VAEALIFGTSQLECSIRLRWLKMKSAVEEPMEAVRKLWLRKYGFVVFDNPQAPGPGIQKVRRRC